MYLFEGGGGSDGIVLEPNWPGLDGKPGESLVNAQELIKIADFLEENRPEFPSFAGSRVTAEDFAAAQAGMALWPVPVQLGTAAADATNTLGEFIRQFLAQYDLAIHLMRVAAGRHSAAEDEASRRSGSVDV